MKRHLYITLITVLFALSAGTAQNYYADKWREVEQFEVEDKIEDAEKVVTEIYKRARRKKHQDQYIKVFLFRAKYQLVNKEDAQDQIIADLNELISKADFPNKNIYHGIMAKLLDDYAKANQWRIRNRTAGVNEGDDFKAWDATRFYSEIHKHYQLSLSQPDQLVKIPLSDYSAIVGPIAPARVLRPSLLDILSHQALDFYKSGYFNLTQPKEVFKITTTNAFLEATEIKKLQRPAGDTVFSKYDILQLYADLEIMHRKRKNDPAYIHITNDRLNYTKSQLRNTDSLQVYEERLQSLIKNYSDSPAITEIYHSLASYYYDLSNKKDHKDAMTYRKKSIATAETGVTLFPDSYGSIMCSKLLERIRHPELSIQIENMLIPDRPHRGVMTYKNIAETTLYYIKESFDYAFKRSTDSIYEAYVNNAIQMNRIAHEEKIALPKGEDTFSHSYEYAVPELTAGRYFIFSKTQLKDDVKYEKTTITISNLALFKNTVNGRTEITVKNRTTGKAEENVKIKIKYDKKSKNLTTDRNGKADFFLSSKRSYNITLAATKNDDTITSSFYNYNYRNNNDNDASEDLDVKSFIYLDRAIYRPGQTVYFKSILLQKQGKITSVVPNEPLYVYAENVNGEDIFETELTTNEYGSIHGSFEIPKDVLTGEFTLYVESSEEVDTPLYKKSDNWNEAEIYFQVEEYKRPTFKVDFKEITQTYQLGDSITVTGTAKAFLGSNITDATVNYIVYRGYRYSKWYRGYYNNDDQVIAQGESITNSSGEFDITFLASGDTGADDAFSPIYSYRIEADVTDVNGETRSSETSLRVGKNSIEAILISGNDLTVGDSIQVGVKNLNGQYVNGKVLFQLRKKQEPNHLIVSSGLQQAELHELNDANYRKTFPYAPLRKSEQIEDWKDNPILFQKELTTDSLTTIALPLTQQWENGTYILYVQAVEPDQSFDDEDTIVEARQEKSVWVDKELPKDNSLLSIVGLRENNTANIDVYTIANGTYATIYVWDKKRLIEEKEVFLPRGKNRFSYSLNNITGNMLNFRIQAIHENSFAQQNTSVSKPIVPVDFYSIETGTFRNKLEPGIDETWSFTLKNKAGNPMQAEVLASMYDKSLDEFTSAIWNQPYMYHYESSFSPRFPSAITIKSTATVFFRSNSGYEYSTTAYPMLNTHGLSFDNPMREFNNYKYRLSEKNKSLMTIENKVTGQLVDHNGVPLYGISLSIRGRDEKTYSNYKGVFILEASENDIIEINSFGFKSKTIKIKNEDPIQIVLEYSTDQFTMMQNDFKNLVVFGSADYGIEQFDEFDSLDSVVIVGNNEKSRRSKRMSVEEDVAFEVGEPRENGVSSLPSGSTQVIVRGAYSPNGGLTDPLYVIDGVYVDANKIPELDSDAIESLSVLTDAAQTALYGSRGANGVIIITTKKGVSIEDIKFNDKLDNITARKNLQETAFFLPQLRTDEQGNLKFNFKTPEALTQWKLRLLAHNKQAETAQLEQLIVTQKELNIIPNAPRFLRETDTIRFSAKIANLSDAAMDGIARLQLFDAMTMNAIDDNLGNVNNIRKFEIDKGGNTSVNWTFRIPLGTQAVTYRVVAQSGSFSDGQEDTLPVLTNRMLVTESRVLWVRSGETGTAVMDKLATNTSATLANHQLTFEYTSNPSWYAIKSLPYLMEYEHECSEQTFSRYYANAVASHILNSNPKVKEVFDSWASNGTNVSNLEKNEELKSVILAHTPWLRDAQSEAQKQQRLATLFDLEKTARAKKKTLAKLEQLQQYSGGFSWFNGGRESEYITRHIVAGIGHLDRLNVNQEDAPQLNRLFKNGMAFLDNEHKNSIREFLKRKNAKLENYSTGVSYWHYLYASSFQPAGVQKSYKLTKDMVTVRNYAFAKAEKEQATYSLYHKLLVAMVAHRSGKTELASDIVEGLRQTAVKSDSNGMYWKENTNSWYWYSSDIETQALAIAVFQEVANDAKSVEELKIWLLKNKRTNRWKSTKATADATYALLLQGDNWLDVRENNVIKWGNKSIAKEKLAEVEKEAGSGYFKVSLDAPEVNPAMATVSVKNKSDVTGYGALHWQYFEDLDNITVDDNLPLSIKKKLYKKVTTDSGEQLVEITRNAPLQLGDRITVRLEIRASNDMDYVHLKDMRSSGFEPIDVISKYQWQDGLGYYQSTKDVATHFFFDRMSKGTYVFEYDVRANNAGQFSNGIATLECMYAPEFSSHSEGTRVEIVE